MKRFLISLCIFVVLAGVIIALSIPRVRSVRADVEERRQAALYEAVCSAARQCYAVEGVYPETLDYLEEHCGLLINHDKYIVTYECSASNEAPVVAVLKR